MVCCVQPGCHGLSQVSKMAELLLIDINENDLYLIKLSEKGKGHDKVI
jgi:hypothetical protein